MRRQRPPICDARVWNNVAALKYTPSFPPLSQVVASDILALFPPTSRPRKRCNYGDREMILRSPLLKRTPLALYLRPRSPSSRTLIPPLGGFDRPPSRRYVAAMSINLRSHAFAGNPLRSSHPKSEGSSSPSSALDALKSLLSGSADGSSEFARVLPFKKGRPLARSVDSTSGSAPRWNLGWISAAKFGDLPAESFVYLGSGPEEEAGTVSWAVDVSDAGNVELGGGGDGLCFVELRTLMVATDWADAAAMGELAIAGHARSLLEWHNVSRFCGHCGARTVSIDAGRRKQCTNGSCKKRIYPRVDPVVIMLVLDKENDRALLSHQSRFVPRMWSCLAGFIEPGESLEEAVRRETREETGVEVGEVVYHSSQPWPVGPSSMPCQLMVGFFAYAKSFDIHVDKVELEDAQWHKREDVKKALTFAEYEKAQKTAALKVNQMCGGVEGGPNFSSDFNVESGELAPMFVPGPYAIAHHLISSWVHEGQVYMKEDGIYNEEKDAHSKRKATNKEDAVKGHECSVHSSMDH
ncbi:hypothetical protein OPV22_023927 [Ensete ventricosum]|uniref:NAD(+) diphosphatase n=1 Tax=Ensete ventricosum TaxID=4639 RepID=A0AAV8PDE7_ENSVE|nr:hypothetical protein OPV22_023927 [Ensete ventricosum]